MPGRARSGRELRRRQAREDRKLLLGMEQRPLEHQKAVLFRNGITAEDLKREYYKGAADGRKHAEEFAFHAIYAAFLITMIDHHGMEADEAVDLLIEMDHQVVTCIEDEDLIREAYDRTGIELNWNEAIERVARKETTDE